MLLDSNIIIYASKPEYSNLLQFIAEESPFVSAVSYVEVLGYHKLTDFDKAYFKDFFESAIILAISNEVLEEAIKLRQQRKMALGDALIAGTALTHNIPLITRNTDDFKWISDLEILNPFDNGE